MFIVVYITSTKRKWGLLMRLKTNGEYLSSRSLGIVDIPFTNISRNRFNIRKTVNI